MGRASSRKLARQAEPGHYLVKQFKKNLDRLKATGKVADIERYQILEGMFCEIMGDKERITDLDKEGQRIIVLLVLEALEMMHKWQWADNYPMINKAINFAKETELYRKKVGDESQNLSKAQAQSGLVSQSVLYSKDKEPDFVG